MQVEERVLDERKDTEEDGIDVMRYHQEAGKYS